MFYVFFFFQAEDGIRDLTVTGVQTCALPIFMKILVTGSIAYDTIMVFPDRFRNHLLADQLHILNVCFLAPEMRREYSGAAGNISYNLRLLGQRPLIIGTAGAESPPYLDAFGALCIGTSRLKRDY